MPTLNLPPCPVTCRLTRPIPLPLSDGRDKLRETVHYTKLDAAGLSVGLPEGVMGNSEVGHLTIGAGQAQYQDLVRINLAMKSGDFKTNPAIKAAFERAKAGNWRLHLLGLVSDGGVHSHNTHLYGAGP